MGREFTEKEIDAARKDFERIGELAKDPYVAEAISLGPIHPYGCAVEERDWLTRRRKTSKERREEERLINILLYPDK